MGIPAMELVGFGLSRKNKFKNGSTRKNEEYFEAGEMVYLGLLKNSKRRSKRKIKSRHRLKLKK